MGIQLGTQPVKDFKVGTTQVKEIYLGTTLVWPDYIVNYPQFPASEAERETIGTYETDWWRDLVFNTGSFPVLVDPTIANVGRWSSAGLPATTAWALGFRLPGLVNGRTYNYDITVYEQAHGIGLGGSRPAVFSIGTAPNNIFGVATKFGDSNAPATAYNFTGTFSSGVTGNGFAMVASNSLGHSGASSPYNDVPDPRSYAFLNIRVW